MRRLCALALLSGIAAGAQTSSDPAQTPTLSTTTVLVRIPTMVTTKSGEPVFTLTAKDFLVTDDDVPQAATLDDDTGAQPLALVIAIETGGAGSRHLDALRSLPNFLDTIVGGIPHRVALVTFDSTPALAQEFTPDLDTVGKALGQMQAGDQGAATLDALKFSVEELRGQPLQYRRAILLISETVDHGSHVGLEQALRVIGDTNTSIYSVAFSSSRSMAKHETAKMFSGPPGPAHGCMSKDSEITADSPDNRFEQAYDCLSLLAPPLRLIKVATLAAMDSLRKNVPETVARQTGGEYVTFGNERAVEHGLLSISNHLPNQYVLSFHPQAPHAGFHRLGVTLTEHADLKISARGSYWAADAPGVVLPSPAP